MNYGPVVFLASFLALAISWFSFVLKPQMQLGHMVPTNTIPAGVSYPTARPGLAQQGLMVYRANGCYECHSQQVVQDGAFFEVILRDAGTNRDVVMTSIGFISPKLTNDHSAMEGLPKPVLTHATKEQTDSAIKLLTASGAKATPWLTATGPDISRGWGRRRTVAEDYLYDEVVMTGSQRIGPDLANVGLRQPDIQWHLRHFYNPGAVVKGSIMPPYRYLFEKRRIGQRPSADALALTPDFKVEPGYEIVPKADAIALAMYMISLRADAPLFSAPFSVASAPPASAADAGATNAPAPGGATAAPSTNAPASSTPAPAPAQPQAASTISEAGKQ